jgi:electron transport complex protein RnfA
MEIKYLAAIILGTILINNYVLTRVFRLSPFMNATRKFDFAFGMGMAVTFAMVLSSFVTFPIYTYVLAPFGFAYLTTVVFILVIVALVQVAEMSIRKTAPVLHRSLGVYLPLVTTNCAVLGAASITISPGLFGPNASSLVAGAVRGFGAGAGFTLALVIMAGIQERLELADIPEKLRGAPIAFITAGLLALAFFGFSGLKI